MRKRFVKVIFVAILMLVSGDLFFVTAAEIKWHSGRVVSASLSGHGPAGENRSKNERRADAWWTYCVSSGDQCYSVVSRIAPDRIGLTDNRVVRFYVNKNLFYVTDPNGKRVALRILRKDKAKTCP